MLEEAWEDESTLANLETELENSEERLSMALAESAQLRSQLAAANNRNRHELENCPTDPTVRNFHLIYLCIQENYKVDVCYSDTSPLYTRFSSDMETSD